MGLKERLKQQPFETELPEQSELQSRPKDLVLIQELTDKITKLTLINSELQSKNQEMQSALTTANEQIETLTERASNLNEVEKKNESLNEQAAAALTTRDRALREAKAAEERTEYLRRMAQEAEDRKHKADMATWNAESQARKAQDSTKRAQRRYKSASIALGAVAVVQAVLLSWGHGGAWGEIGQWWVLRWHNFMSAGRGIGAAFLWTAARLGSWGVPEPWGYVIAVVLALALLTGLFFLGRAGVTALATVLHRIRQQYHDGIWKASMTAATALALFFICLWAYTPIRAAWPFNIFSLWLALSFIGGMAWNFQEIKGGLMHEY